MGVQADWLTARVAADDRARAGTVTTLLPQLVAHLRRGGGAAHLGRSGAADVRLVDVGAGSGANQRWLSPRLPFAQRWVHLDHDAAILGHTDGVGPTDVVVGGIETLPELLDGDPGPTVVTCAAVLDVLTRSDLAALCALLISRRTPALLALSVTGELELDPPHAEDAGLLAAFNAHQRRDGRAGPDAPDLVVEHCRAAGVDVVETPTDWVLDGRDDPTFVTRFLRERVEAAVEQDPSSAEAGRRWLADRRSRLEDGRLRVVVGHRDLLLLP